MTAANASATSRMKGIYPSDLKLLENYLTMDLCISRLWAIKINWCSKGIHNNGLKGIKKGSKASLIDLFYQKYRYYLAAAFTIAAKLWASKDAPPTSAPSMSGWLK